MNQQARNTVNSKLLSLFPNGVTTLYFANYEGIDAFRNKNPFEGLGLDTSIMRCLQYNKEYESFFSGKNNEWCETPSGANRSVIDIWRHIKHYNPDLTIFEVMDCLYDLVYEDNDINCFICGDIGRRVFIIDEDVFYLNDGDMYDVFHITFDEWKNI
jgi:hypothetical protein